MKGYNVGKRKNYRAQKFFLTIVAKSTIVIGIAGENDFLAT